MMQEMKMEMRTRLNLDHLFPPPKALVSEAKIATREGMEIPVCTERLPPDY
jgi:hypothetical protein